MVRLLLILLIFVFTLSGCQRKDHNQEEDQQKKSEPIPTNPQHS